MAYLTVKPTMMVLLVAVAVIFAVSEVAATSGYRGTTKSLPTKNPPNKSPPSKSLPVYSPSKHHSPPSRSSSPGPGPNKPDCKKKGGMCGNPKIVGGDGVVFYFHGHKDQNFCLVFDNNLHINAHFISKRPNGRQRDFTWVQALGFVFRDHTVTIAANKVAH